MPILNSKEMILTILKDNPPLCQSEIMEEYTKKAASTSVQPRTIRKHVEELLATRQIKRTSDYIFRRGYYYTHADNAAPVAKTHADQLQFGNSTGAALEIIKELWLSDSHRIIRPDHWNTVRFNYILLALNAHPNNNLDVEGFRAALEQFRDAVAETLQQINGVLLSDMWLDSKQKQVLETVPNASVIVEEIQAFLRGEISEVREWE